MFIGEVGLGGEIRAVSQAERRVLEAEKMGMRVAYMAARSVPKRAPRQLKVRGVADLGELFRELFR